MMLTTAMQIQMHSSNDARDNKTADRRQRQTRYMLEKLDIQKVIVCLKDSFKGDLVRWDGPFPTHARHARCTSCKKVFPDEEAARWEIAGKCKSKATNGEGSCHYSVEKGS